jgi:nucleotide-binding universal stress UspA family protein
MIRILVPTDFSEPSLAAVRSGIELAAEVGGVVCLLHVVEGAAVRCYAVGGLPLFLSDMIDPDGESFRFRFDQPLIHRDFCEEARWKLDSLIPPSCQTRVHAMVTVGRPVAEIVWVAREHHADLILLGARVLRGRRHVFRRTTAERVRRKVLIPVVTLDAEDACLGRDPGRRHVAGDRPGRRRLASHGGELAGVVQKTDAPPRPPRVESTAASDAPMSPGAGRDGWGCWRAWLQKGLSSIIFGLRVDPGTRRSTD